jgi:hypothetical protein
MLRSASLAIQRRKATGILSSGGTFAEFRLRPRGKLYQAATVAAGGAAERVPEPVTRNVPPKCAITGCNGIAAS